MSEVVVGLTDYLLTLECALFSGILMRTTGAWAEVRRYFAVFFLAAALTSLTGGTYHVWFSNSASVPASILWTTTVVALGGVAFAAWAIGACLLFVEPVRGRVIKAALVAFLAYSIYVAAIDDRFRVAIANYIPSVIFLAIAFTLWYRRRRESPVLTGLFGLIVTGIAAAIQRSGWSLDQTLFNHNATYHLVQAIGFFLIFRAAIFLARKPFQEAGDPS